MVKKFFADKLPAIVGATTAAVTLTAIIASFFNFLEFSQSKNEITIEEISSALERSWQEDLLIAKAELEQELSSIVSQNPVPEGSEVRIKIDQLDRRINEAFEKLEIVEMISNAIQESPERALSLPIMRRDLDALSEEMADDLISIRGEIDRIYDLGKWFLGLVATMAIGVLGLAIGNLIKGRE